jgi:hypothetical protein
MNPLPPGEGQVVVAQPLNPPYSKEDFLQVEIDSKSGTESNTFLLVTKGFSWPKEPLAIDLILQLSCKYYKDGS